MKTVMSSFRFFLPVRDMNMKRKPWANKLLSILVICLLTLYGCLLESQEPVGEAPASINPQEWEGTWLSLEKKTDTLVLQVVDAPRGILLMKTRTWSEEKRREVVSPYSEVYLRRTGNRLFASWKAVGATTFTWGKIGNWALEDGGRVLLVWLPDEREISRLIKRGELPGRLEGERGKEWPILGALLPKHYRVMRDREKEIFSGPFVFVRQAKE